MELFCRHGWCHGGRDGPTDQAALLPAQGGLGAWEGTGLLKAGGLGSHACLSWWDPDKPF